MDDENNIINYFNGLFDIKNKILKQVSPSFKEDPLRILRLGRFYAKFNDFSIASETIAFVKEMIRQGILDYINIYNF